jgi:hypothetical protein
MIAHYRYPEFTAEREVLDFIGIKKFKTKSSRIVWLELIIMKNLRFYCSREYDFVICPGI